MHAPCVPADTRYAEAVARLARTGDLDDGTYERNAFPPDADDLRPVVEGYPGITLAVEVKRDRAQPVSFTGDRRDGHSGVPLVRGRCSHVECCRREKGCTWRAGEIQPLPMPVIQVSGNVKGQLVQFLAYALDGRMAVAQALDLTAVQRADGLAGACPQG